MRHFASTVAHCSYSILSAPPCIEYPMRYCRLPHHSQLRRKNAGSSSVHTVIVRCTHTALVDASAAWSDLKGVFAALAGIDTQQDVDNVQAALQCALQEHSKGAFQVQRPCIRCR